MTNFSWKQYPVLTTNHDDDTVSPDLDPEISSGGSSSQHCKSNITMYAHRLTLLLFQNDPGESALECVGAQR